MRRTLRLFIMLGIIIAVAACAAEHLAAGAPSGIDLSGDWKLNPNLSDDPDKPAPAEQPTRQRSRRGRAGAGSGTGLPPMGGPNFAPAEGAPAAAPPVSPWSDPTARSVFEDQSLEQSNPLPPVSAQPLESTQGARPGPARLLQAPQQLAIRQNGAVISIKATMADGSTFTDDYTGGTRNTIPYGRDSQADRAAGWRGPVFVVTTSAKSGGTREEDYGLDDDGRLIVTTQTHGGRVGKNELRRVYDRVRS